MQLRALTLLLAAFLLSFVSAQQATTTDADGNSIIISVDDDATETISTITSSADDDDDSGGITLPAAVGDGPRTTSNAPATTYASYEQLPGGGQETHWLTFVATTPATEDPLSVPSGTILDAKDFLASLSKEAASVEATHSASGASASSSITWSALLACGSVAAGATTLLLF